MTSDVYSESETDSKIQASNFGFKNYIINGNKSINQRGLTATDNSYNQDRWYKAGNNWYQGIELLSLTSGKTYTLSWTGAATAGYYVGNATSATINAQTFTSIANGGSFTLTISTGQNLWIKFASDATGSTFNNVQLEQGSVATPFENRPFGLEEMLCQRYYEKGSVLAEFMSPGTTQYFSRIVEFKVKKRVYPSVVISFAGVNGKVRVSDAPAFSTNILVSADLHSLSVTETGVSGVSRNFVDFDYIALADL